MPFFSIRPGALFNIRSRRGVPYLYRQIITTGYTAGGYKDGVAWRNVNSQSHATETTTNLGDLLQEAGNYNGGAHNKNNAFMFGTNGTGTQGVGAFTSTSCFNMRNNTNLTKTPAMNTTYTVGQPGVVSQTDEDGDYRYAWQNGGQGAAYIQKFNLQVEIHQSVIASSMSQAGTGAAAHWGENYGYWWGDAATTDTTYRRKWVYSTETESVPGGLVGWHGQQKGQSTKTGVGYAGNEGSYNGGNIYKKWNYTTEAIVSTHTRPIQDQGEENYIMGQTKSYMLGAYGAPGPVQHNRSQWWTLATDSGGEFGASGQPTGTQSGTGSTAGAAIAGRSSGVGYWRD